MSSVLPAAELMLTEQRAFCPFGSTLSISGEIVQVGGFGRDANPNSAALRTQFQETFREGAVRGELKATALVYSAPCVPPGKLQQQQAVFVQLDHRGAYSLVVAFPYGFSEAGELVIEEPFATEGEYKIFKG